MSDNPERSYCHKQAKFLLVCVSCYTAVERVAITKNGREIWRCGTCGKTRNRKQRFWMEYDFKITYLQDAVMLVSKEGKPTNVLLTKDGCFI